MNGPIQPHADWFYPTRVRFGAGRIAELPEACREAGIRRPLLVTGPTLVAGTMIRDAVAASAAAGLPIGLFSALRSNPTGRQVMAGVAAFRQGGHDGVIAFGGGSALDAGKLIAFMSAQTRPLWDFEDGTDGWTRATVEGIAPVIAVPTTAGTGSELGRAAVATDEATRTKKILFHPRMMPIAVIADPILTLGMGPALTAGTGMDALAHCFEAYCARGYHPLAEGVAVEGMRLIKEWLPRAVADGSDIEARGHMLAASGMGAAAFQKGLGAIHALSHPVSGLYDTHHGLTNGVFFPYVMAFNREAIAGRCDRLAAWLGLPGTGFDACLDWILELRAEIGIPHTAQALGVRSDDLEKLARRAAADPTAIGNPVPVGPAELRRLYEMALDGRLTV